MNAEQSEEVPRAAPPVPEVESAMRTGQGDDDAGDAMTIGEKYGDAPVPDADAGDGATDPKTLAEAEAALGAGKEEDAGSGI